MPLVTLLAAVALMTTAADAGLDRAAVKRQIRRDLRVCYTPLLRSHPRAPGTITVSLSVTSTGSAEALQVAGIDPAADECLRTKAPGWRFASTSGGSTSIQLSVPAAEIDPDGSPITLAEIRPLLDLPAGATVLEPLDDDGLDQLRERLCSPGAASENGADEAANALARSLEAKGWKAVVKPESGERATRRLNASQKGYQLGGRLAPASAGARCQGYDVSLSIRAPHAATAH